MTTVNEWINADPQRRAPEFDFGTQWTREHDPTTEWAVTYNTGTGELYARTQDGSDVEVLGQFADPQDVAEALPDWGRRSMQAGSLDWVRREALTLQQSQPTVKGDDPVYAIALSVDGDATALRTPQSIGDVAIRLDAPDLDVARVNTGDRTDRVLIWVDDHSREKNLPVNAAATQLYGSGWPILGDAIVVTDNKTPLPPALVQDLIDLEQPQQTYALRVSPGGDITTIDNWSDAKVASRELVSQLHATHHLDDAGSVTDLGVWSAPDEQATHAPRNDVATAIVAADPPIHGDAIVVALDGRSIPPAVTERLTNDAELFRSTHALEYEDHHRDRDADPDLNDDVDLEPAELGLIDHDVDRSDVDLDDDTDIDL